MRMPITRSHILIALALGLMLGFFLRGYGPSQPAGFIPVVVAGADISAGTVLRSRNLQVIQWPREYLPAHTARMEKEVEGWVATSPVTKGEPVLLPKLAQR